MLIIPLALIAFINAVDISQYIGGPSAQSENNWVD